MLFVGDGQDEDARDLVLRQNTPAPFPGLLVFDPDSLALLAKTNFNATAAETLATLGGVLSARSALPFAASAEPPADGPLNPAQEALRGIELRLDAAPAGKTLGFAHELERWLAEHSVEFAASVPNALILLGNARYLSEDFSGAADAWNELIRRFPGHPLRHRASYNLLDHRVWAEPPHPSIARGRLPGLNETGVQIPYPEVRTRNIEAVRNDARYRHSPSGVPFVLVPAGNFTMGGQPAGGPRERPLRHVTITRPFLLAAWPVTRSLWRTVFPDAWPGAESDGAAGELPATEVSWQLAQQFIDVLSARDGWQYRCPTEAEWEYAARDGIESAPFPWGHEPLDPTRCNYNLPRPVPVGCYPPTRRGLFDMLGNVCEFSSDLWRSDAYSLTPASVIDPQGPSLEDVPAGTRVVMPSASGSELFQLHARISWRAAAPASYRGPANGLRLACELPATA